MTTKKILTLMGSFMLVVGGFVVGSSTLANCVSTMYGNVCLNMTWFGGSTYQVQRTLPSNLTNPSLLCEILTDDGVIHPLDDCNKTFTYNSIGSRVVKFYVTLNGDYRTQSFTYNFGTNSSTLVPTTTNNFPTNSSSLVGSVNTSNPSLVAGFTTKQLNEVRSVYNLRPNLVSTLKSRHWKLQNNSNRQSQSDQIYIQMQKILTNDSTRIYKTYQQFYNAVVDWIRLTIQVR